MTEEEAVGAAEAVPQRPDPQVDAAAAADANSDARPDAAPVRPTKAERKAERKAAKRAAREGRKAVEAARPEAKRVAKAERKAAAKAEAKAEAKAAKAERKAAKAGRKAAKRAARAEEETVARAEEPAAHILEERVETLGVEPPSADTPGAETSGAATPAPDDRALAMGPRAVIGAAVDVGANSAHLLVAAAGGHRVEPLLDESVFLGLGDRVARDGLIGAAGREELVEALAGYAATARRLGARDLVFLGTEPVRRALDAATLVHEVEARAGVALHVIDHEEEAMLMLLGVTLGRPVRVETLVIDIGGGSCEFVITGPGRPVHSAGLRLGCASLTQDAVEADPPTADEVETMRRVARAVVAGAPHATPVEIVAVGGTASNMLRLLPAASLDRVLSRRRMAEALALVMQESSAEAAERHLLRPQRTRILPAGIVIADAILERYGAKRLRVSEEGIREGAVLAAAAFGSAWRDQLPVLVAGWPDEPPEGD